MGGLIYEGITGDPRTCLDLHIIPISLPPPPCLFSAEVSRAVHAPRDSREVHAHHLSQNAAVSRRNSFAEAFRRFPLVSRHLGAPSLSPLSPPMSRHEDDKSAGIKSIYIYMYILKKKGKGGRSHKRCVNTSCRGRERFQGKQLDCES